MRGHNLIIAVITTLVVSQLDTSLAINCFNCTSSESANCITNPSGESSIDCNGSCFTSTDGKGKVTRGCLLSGATCTDSANCPTCTTNNCNTNAVCYKCSGESCNTAAPDMLSACADSSKCFTTGSSATNMTRGCTADTTQTYKCPADTADTSCAICDASQCNNVAYQRSEGSCITCTDCAKVQENNSNAKSCSILYNQNFTGCYTTAAGARGCLVSLEGECTDANSCQSCTGDNCNTAGQEFQCIACLSSEVSGCWSGTGTDLPKVACPNETCFSGVWNGLGVRDCMTAGSELMQYQCEKKVAPYKCETCKTSLCNTVDLNGAGSLSHMGVVGLLLGLLVVLRSA